MTRGRTRLTRLASEYGIVLALIALCGAFSAATVADQTPEGAAAGEAVARQAVERGGARVIVVAGHGRDDAAFADAARSALERAGRAPVAVIAGPPSDARRAIEQLAARGQGPDVI